MNVGATTARLSMILSTRPSTAADGPDRELRGEQHLAEGVRQRQPEVLHVVGGEQPGRVDGDALVDPAVVRQPDALGPAGRARRVDQGREVLGTRRVDAVGHRRGVLREQVGAAGGQVVEADHPVAVRRAVERDDLAQVRQLVALLAQLGDLGVVLGERDPGAGVGEDVGDVLGVGRRVDRGGGGAGAEDREVGEDPVDPRRGQDRDPLLRLDAEGEQPGRERGHPLAGLAPGHALPRVAHRPAVGLAAGRRRHPVEEHPADRRRPAVDARRLVSRRSGHAAALRLVIPV